jgi:tetratricopeptide (TPR) repeat protein
MKYCFLAASFLFLNLFCQAQDPDAIISYGYELYAEGEYVLALQQFELAETVSKGSTQARLGIGKAYFQLTDYDEAKRALESVNRAGEYSEARYYLGRIYFLKHDYSQALYQFQKAYATDTINDDLGYFLGASLFETGDNPAAIDQLELDLIKHPDYDYSYYYYAQALLVAGKSDSALMAINQALNINALIPRFHRAKGDIYFEKQNYSTALLHYTDALNLNPAYAEARLRRGIAYGALSRYSLAIVDLEEAQKRLPIEPLIPEMLAQYKFDTGDYEGSEAALNRLMNIEPDRTELLFKRGLCYFYMEKYEEAIDDFSVLHDAFGADSEVQFYLGNCYEAKRDLPSAIYHYSQAVELDFNNLRAHHNRAVVLFEVGKTEQACKAWAWLSERTDEYFSKLGKEHLELYCN